MTNAKFLRYRYILGAAMNLADAALFIRINGIDSANTHDGTGIYVPQGGGTITSFNPNAWASNSCATLDTHATGFGALFVEGTIVQQGTSGIVYVTARSYRARFGEATMDYLERGSAVSPAAPMTTVSIHAFAGGVPTNHIAGTTFELWYEG
jgi:hypothetical protein